MRARVVERMTAWDAYLELEKPIYLEEIEMGIDECLE